MKGHSIKGCRKACLLRSQKCLKENMSLIGAWVPYCQPRKGLYAREVSTMGSPCPAAPHSNMLYRGLWSYMLRNLSSHKLQALKKECARNWSLATPFQA